MRGQAKFYAVLTVREPIHEVNVQFDEPRHNVHIQFEKPEEVEFAEPPENAHITNGKLIHNEPGKLQLLRSGYLENDEITPNIHLEEEASFSLPDHGELQVISTAYDAQIQSVSCYTKVLASELPETSEARNPVAVCSNNTDVGSAVLSNDGKLVGVVSSRLRDVIIITWFTPDVVRSLCQLMMEDGADDKPAQCYYLKEQQSNIQYVKVSVTDPNFSSSK